MRNTKTLTPDERLSFEKCEAIISMGFRTFYEVGIALLKVSDDRLYREEFSTFEEYCKARWAITANYAYRLSHAAEVINDLKEKLPIGNTLPVPTSESTVRPLTFVENQGDRAECYKEAVKLAGGKEPTARHVSRAIDKVNPKSKREPKKKSVQSSDPMLDEALKQQALMQRLERWFDEGIRLSAIDGLKVQVHLNATKIAALTKPAEPSNVLPLERKTA